MFTVSEFDDLKPPELTQEERDQAQKVLADMGCVVRFSDGNRDLSVLGYLGAGLRVLLDQYPQDQRIRADVALYNAWQALPLASGYERTTAALPAKPDTYGAALGHHGGGPDAAAQR